MYIPPVAFVLLRWTKHGFGRKRNETAPSCAKTAQHGATFWRKAGDIPELLDHQRRAAA